MLKRIILKTIAVLTGAFIIAAAFPAVGTLNADVKKFNMSYVYFGSPSAYITKVEKTKGSLNEIAPNYFDLNTDGSLKLTSSIDRNFIDEMHEKGVKVVPFLSNHWNRQIGRFALQNRETLASQVADAISSYNLDGVNIDLENLNEEDRTNYTDLVRLIREKLPSGKTVAIAVAPNPYGFTRGWQGSYDYGALAGYCDYLMVMAYDESYQGGPAGPVAGASFVEASIKYAVARVSPEKVVLGIPFYGRYWKNEESYGGYGISLTDVDKFIKRYDGNVTLDGTVMAPKAVFTIKPGDEELKVFGKILPAGTYTIWYENEQSIKYKLELANRYGLKGSGSWSLGQELPDVWNY